MGPRRHSTVVILFGAVGVLVGLILAANGPSDPVWTKDTDFQWSVALVLILVGIAAWHHRRFGVGKLITICLLAAGLLLPAVLRIDADPPGPSGDERIGLWLMVVSAVMVLIGAVWSYFAERPADYSPQRGLLVMPAELATEERSHPQGRWYPPSSLGLRTRLKVSPAPILPTTARGRAAVLLLGACFARR